MRDGLAQKTKWKVAGPSLINNVDTFSLVGVVLYTDPFNVVTTGHCEKWEWITCEVGSQEATLVEEDYYINSSRNGEVKYLSLGGIE